MISSQFAPLEMQYEDKHRAVVTCLVAMNDEGGKGKPGKSELGGSPGKGPWHDVGSTMRLEMNWNNLSNGVTEVG